MLVFFIKLLEVVYEKSKDVFNITRSGSNNYNGIFADKFSGAVAGEKSKNINAGEISEMPDEEYVLPYGISIGE